MLLSSSRRERMPNGEGHTGVPKPWTCKGCHPLSAATRHCWPGHVSSSPLSSSLLVSFSPPSRASSQKSRAKALPFPTSFSFLHLDGTLLRASQGLRKRIRSQRCRPRLFSLEPSQRQRQPISAKTISTPRPASRRKISASSAASPTMPPSAAFAIPSP